MKVLAIGAHPDDVELGCGGTLAAHRANGDDVSILVMTTGEQGPQASGSRRHEQEEAAALVGAALYWGNFEDCAVPNDRHTIDMIDAVRREAGADTVYTHAPHDTHQDHRATSMATLAAARRASSVLLYESPTSVNFTPHLYVDIADHLALKVRMLEAHMSQVLKNGLVDLEAVEAQARFRGFQARIHHAEGFETDRFVWDLKTRIADRVDLTVARELEEALR